jgi:hypothetical protein
MLYNENISYSQPGLTYIGTIVINVVSLNNPIILSNIFVTVNSTEDYSNATTVAVLSYDIMPEGILVIEATESQASAIVQIASQTSASSAAEITLISS